MEMETAEDKEQAENDQKAYASLTEFLQKHLDVYVKQVRISNRLTTSPVCLVVDEHDRSPKAGPVV